MSRYAARGGRIVKGWTVRLDPLPEQVARFRRDCSARRFAYNWAVSRISESFAAGRESGDYDPEGSRRWREARRRLNRTQARVAAIRSDTLHKATTRLAKTHGQVVIEDLAVRSLTRGLRVPPEVLD